MIFLHIAVVCGLSYNLLVLSDDGLVINSVSERIGERRLLTAKNDGDAGI